MDSYNVKTHIFEGPLDTLLALIERRKLFINDISLAQVADDYIAYIRSVDPALNPSVDESGDQKQNPVSDLTHFILIASTLVLIKSKSLLPNLTLSEEEESSIHDLEARLREYQKYKELSRHLKARFGIETKYLRLPSKEKVVLFTPDKNTSVARIQETLHSLILGMPKKELVPKAVVKQVISLEETIDSLTKRITESMKMSFKDFALNHSVQNGRGSVSSSLAGMNPEEKVNVIVSFLAMLELVKQGIIQVRQDKDFHDIEMENQQIGVPTY